MPAITEEVKDAIRYYHRLGYTHKVICHLLTSRHNVHITFDYLKRKIIPKLRLNNRRGSAHLTHFDDVYEAIQYERTIKDDISVGEIFSRLKMNYGYTIRRKLVREIMAVLDPVGLISRKGNKLKRRIYISKGPNWVWHIDGYDKLSPYGICITGCIDGFSRYVVWLKAGRSNKDPKKIASCFMESVEFLSSCPHKVRADAGTENVVVASIQNMLRQEDGDSFVYGKSTHNQRIERWWGILRKKCTDRWIDHFKTLQGDGLLIPGNKVHQCLVQFSDLNLIRVELIDVRNAWNHHRIRKQTVGDVISGIPDLLYNNPEMLGLQDWSHPVDIRSEEFTFLKTKAEWDNNIDPDFNSAAILICQQHGVEYQPQNIIEAKNIFLKRNIEPFLQ